MKITVDENNNILLEEVYVGVALKTNDDEKIYICMRDSGFEFTYEDKKYSAKNGILEEVVQNREDKNNKKYGFSK